MKKIIIGLLASAWLLIAFLFCRCDYLSRNLQVAQQNVSALNDTILQEAIAYQTTIKQLRLTNDSLYEASGANKHTKEIIVQKVKVGVHDTLIIPLKDTIIRVADFKLDTTLVNDWRTLRIAIDGNTSNGAVFSLSDDISVNGGLTYRVDREKQPTKAYKTRFGRWLGMLTGHYVKVDKVYVSTDNPLIKLDGTDFIQIIE